MQWPKSVQVEINNALRVALGYKMDDRISIKDLHEKTDLQPVSDTSHSEANRSNTIR
jgi:hypothetical protein